VSISSAGLVQVKGFGSALCSAMKRLIAACRSTIEWKLPRRMRRRVSAEKKVSTALSHEPEPGGQISSAISRTRRAPRSTCWTG
jgi:hypothetical protein